MKFGILTKSDWGWAELQLFGIAVHVHYQGDGGDDCPLRSGVIFQLLGFHMFIGILNIEKL